MAGKYVVSLDEADSGVLAGGGGTYRILIDRHKCGAKNYSLLVNTMNAGTTGSNHMHEDAEHCWYILSGRGKVLIDGEPHPFAPNTGVYVPAKTMHQIVVDPGEDLTYVVIYAPPGPEQELREKGAGAFQMQD